MLKLPPLSLYVHIPWCVRKCPYCDFNSHEAEQIPEQAYVDTLIQDLEQEAIWAQGRKLQSIFFGGGTPSLFSPQAIEKILVKAERVIGFTDDIEITLEANPGTFEQEKFSDFYQAGINRLSIGIQSFQEKHLQKLGRIHSADEATRAINMAKTAGFSNINLDLMHGLPEQTQKEALDDLSQAIALSPQHISWYQLTIEPNTVFYRQPPPLPADETLADIQDAGFQTLSQTGYSQYEVSAFSLAKHHVKYQAKHNLNYWQFGDYIGIGAGAHGKLTDINNQQILRRQKTRLPAHYMNKDAINNVNNKIVDQNELTLEFMMNSLRLTEGVEKVLFNERTGLDFKTVEPIYTQLQGKGLLEKSGTKLKTTALGQQFLNSILSEFM